MLLGDLSLVGGTSKAAEEFKWGKRGHASLPNGSFWSILRFSLPLKKYFFLLTK